MTITSTARCLDCGADLHGRYCSACGQRATPPWPTTREMVVDAWHELTVFDARLLRTLRELLRRPGRLTFEYLAGRKTRYIPPLRVYLIASLAYFLAATFAPPSPLQRQTTTLPGKQEIKIDLSELRELTPEEEAVALKSIERAPPFLRPLFERVIKDPKGVRRNMLEAVPKALFVLVPVFAGILRLFYWRPYPQHLIFALHVHAALFFVLALGRLANFTKSPWVVGIAGAAVMVYVLIYGLRAFRNVYQARWLPLLAKSIAIAVLYGIASGIAIVSAFLWATLVA